MPSRRWRTPFWQWPNRRSAAGTSRGFGADDYRGIAELMLDTLKAVRNGTLDACGPAINGRVRQLVARFPLPY